MIRWKQFTRMGIQALLLSLLVFSSTTHAQTPAETYSFDVIVFEDSNGNATLDSDEPFMSGWQIETFDSSMNQLGQYPVSESIQLSSPSAPSFVCIAPQENWLPTLPSTEHSYPNSNWNCYEFNSASPTYTFGVFNVATDDVEGEVEQIGQIIPPAENETSKDVLPETTDEDLGAVLGATSDDADVLAATGELGSLLPVAGIIIALVALIIRQDSRRYKRY